MIHLMNYHGSPLVANASKMKVSLENYELSIPAIASLAIFQFLWIWNDFLVAKVFLSSKPVLTVQITNLIDPLGANWNIMIGAAFLSFIIPMAVFFGFQKYFARGLLSGSVKG